MSGDQPFIAIADRSATVSLADVVIVPAGGGHERLFDRNPGLVMVLVTRDDTRAEVCFRDGTSFTVVRSPRSARALPWRAVAEVFYGGWVNAIRRSMRSSEEAGPG